MIYNRILGMCGENGITIRQREQRTGIGNGVIGKWKKSIPRADILKRVADYFGVTMDSLFQEEPKLRGSVRLIDGDQEEWWAFQDRDELFRILREIDRGGYEEVFVTVSRGSGDGESD